MIAGLQNKSRAFRNLAVNTIVLSKMDLRTTIDEDKLNELADSMGQVGTIQPILVSHNSRSGGYEVVMGGRRVRAAKKANQKEIPAIIIDDLEESQSLLMMLIENVQRDDLEPLEEANGMVELRDRFNYTEVRLAQEMGKPLDYVSDRLALLRLPERVKTKVAQGRLGVTHAICITHLEGQEQKQIAIADKAEENHLLVAVVARIVQEAGTRKRPYRKMTRKHKLRRSGDPLAEVFMTRKLQQVTLRAEQFLGMLDGLAMNRWSPAQAKKLHDAIVAMEQGLGRFKQRALKRSKEKE